MMKRQQTLYVSPEVKTVEIEPLAIVCQSESTIEDLNLLEDDSENWY